MQRFGGLGAHDDSALIALTRQGYEDAYRELYLRHYRPATAFARSLAGQAIAEEAVSEAFTKILAALRNGKGPAVDFQPYLMVTVRREVWSSANKSSAATSYAGVDELINLPVEVGPETSDGSGVVAAAFKALSSRHRSVLWMVEVEGRRVSEVAAAHQVSPSAASALVVRARKAFRDQYFSIHRRLSGTSACGAVAAELEQFVSNGQQDGVYTEVDVHLNTCQSCSDAVRGVSHIPATLAGFGPIFLGITLPTAPLGGVVHRPVGLIKGGLSKAGLGWVAGATAVVAVAILVLSLKPTAPAPTPRAASVVTVPTQSQPVQTTTDRSSRAASPLLATIPTPAATLPEQPVSNASPLPPTTPKPTQVANTDPVSSSVPALAAGIVRTTVSGNVGNVRTPIAGIAYTATDATGQISRGTTGPTGQFDTSAGGGTISIVITLPVGYQSAAAPAQQQSDGTRTSMFQAMAAAGSTATVDIALAPIAQMFLQLTAGPPSPATGSTTLRWVWAVGSRQGDVSNAVLEQRIVMTAGTTLSLAPGSGCQSDQFGNTLRIRCAVKNVGATPQQLAIVVNLAQVGISGNLDSTAVLTEQEGRAEPASAPNTVRIIAQ